MVGWQTVPMAITIAQLRTFLAVVRAGSVTAAADDLVVTQPSVSAALSALSRELGVDVTERDGRGVRPSAAGEAFAAYALDVVGLLEQGRRAALEASAARTRQLRIAAVPTAAEYLVAPLMLAFSERHPDLELKLEVGNRQRVFDLLVSHRADVCLAGQPRPDGQPLVGEPFLENPIVLITAPGDPLARRPVSVTELAPRPWLLREEGSGTRALNEHFLTHHRLRPELWTLGSNGVIKHAARAGLGISLQSRVAVALELETGLLESIELREELPRRHWHVIRSGVGPALPAVTAFTAFVASAEGTQAVEAARFGSAPAQPSR